MKDSVDTVKTVKTEGTEKTAASEIDAGRERIDELDARIVALIQERMAVSADVQDARIAAGGRRLDLAREMEVLRGYHGRLGQPGTRLAMTLLELCRGPA